VCPFHGRRIGIGASSLQSFHVHEYPTLTLSGMVFARYGDHDCGFLAFMQELDRTYHFLPGPVLHTKARPDLVIENAFDRLHFRAVHGVNSELDLRATEGPAGELVVDATFVTGVSSWQRGSTNDCVSTDFRAHIFSPQVCVTFLRANRQRVVTITGATASERDTIIRVAVGVPIPDEGSPREDILRLLLRDTSDALRQDLDIWDRVLPDARQELIEGDDDLVALFHRFCSDFV
jgi:3-ketosteroid 9alpha-monooxygenase subunit A